VNGRLRGLSFSLLACVALVVGCDHGPTGSQAGAAPARKPNILLVVWDTVRADHLSLYGYHRPTTPYLDEFARRARVFENCVSVGSTTVPTHASMFTGLMPTEHGVSNEQPHLADEFAVLAELLRINGYRTYFFSENPHLCGHNGFTQGFDVAEYPWSPQYDDEALRITLRKLAPKNLRDQLSKELKTGRLDRWRIKAAGELAQRGVENWLPQQDSDRPFLVFLNYMEAHRPLIPPRKYRRQMMTSHQVAASYQLDRRWEGLWSYVFRLREGAPDDIELINATYDAALRELDDLFHGLLESLRASGYLENTIVVLVSDHGEHLGEHHMLDHQFSVYEPLMRVPLVVYYPPRFPPGRETRPVMNIDLFPTLLELAGIEPPIQSKAVSLLNPREKRPRMGEYPAVMKGALILVLEDYPGFDPEPWNRTLRAYYDEPYKFIQTSNGRHELYNLDDDPGELRNLIQERPQLASRLATDLHAYLDSLQEVAAARGSPASGPVDKEYRELLEALGYVSVSQDAGSQDESNDRDDQEPEDGEP
jgi:arylsulfatase A-like enzyme